MSVQDLLRSLPTKTRVFVGLSLLQWLVAAVLLSISLIAVHSGTAPGITWEPESGLIWSVVPDGPADRAGIREGDRLAAVEGTSITSALPPFYGVAPGESANLLVERDSRLLQIPIRTVPKWKLRLDGLSSGPALALRSVTEYLRIGVNVWMLLLAMAILYLRPGLPQARVAAVALTYWVGGNALIEEPGFGTLTAGWPEGVRLGVLFADQLYFVGFLPLFVHFALIFPRPIPLMRRYRWIQVIPYVVATPVLLLATIRMLRVFDPVFRVNAPAYQIDGLLRLYSPGMFLASIAILALHLRHETIENDRRRVRWVLSSMLPPFLTWMLLLGLEAVRAGTVAMAIGRFVFWIGVAVGSLIFVWAIVRHRVFETRVLIRKSIQYALARGTLLVILAAPTILLLIFLWVNRHRSLADLLTTELVAILGLLVPLGLLLRYRRTLLSGIDRRFFREQYDARQTLVDLISMVQKGNDLVSIGRMTLGEIERALHPTHLSLWSIFPNEDQYRAVFSLGDPVPTPALPSGSPVVRLLEQQAGPVQIDLIYPAHSLRKHSSSGQFWIWLSVTRASLIVPLQLDGGVLGFLLLGERRSEEPYTAGDRDLLMALARQLALTESYSRLEELARQDPLTMALNRHAYYSLIEKRGSGGVIEAGCVAVVDLDDLKRINDTFGHAGGDLAIRRVASSIRSVLRADDLIFRWGGDEFLVILFGISEELGRERLEAVNDQMISAEFEAVGPLTVSIGVSRFEGAAELSAAIERADRDMYEQKRLYRHHDRKKQPDRSRIRDRFD